MDHHHLHARLRRVDPYHGQASRPPWPQGGLPPVHLALRHRLGVMRCRAGSGQLLDPHRRARHPGTRRWRHHASCDGGIRHRVPRGKARHGARHRWHGVRPRLHPRADGGQRDPRGVRGNAVAVHLLRKHPHLHHRADSRRQASPERTSRKDGAPRWPGHSHHHANDAQPYVRA